MGIQRTYEELARPPRPGSWEALYWGTIASLMRTVGGRLSEGMRLGYQYGFDSGEMLDYVYRNEAHGAWGIGRLVDRVHLNAIGWRGIRQRKVHLQTLLREAIGRQRAPGRTIHIVDVAAGPGRYLLEVLQKLGQNGVRATLRDWDETGLAQGRGLAQAMGLQQVVRYERGDAFDPHDLAQIAPRPQIVVVSGLYELFPDNALIARSLGGIYGLLEAGGLLIYTNQPTHSQLELIARCLPNREGKPWVMRLRSQEEMDRLVVSAGFQREKTLIDRWGIFTVSIASRGHRS